VAFQGNVLGNTFKGIMSSPTKPPAIVQARTPKPRREPQPPKPLPCGPIVVARKPKLDTTPQRFWGKPLQIVRARNPP
jgi:hypothetical protein